MRTLSNGMKLPETSDRGNTFFPALEDNIETLDAHIGSTEEHGVTGNVLGSENKTEVTLDNNQTTATDVTGLSVDKATHHIALVFVSIRRRTDSTEALAFGWVKLIHKLDAATWSVDWTNFGEDVGITFSVTSAGQLQYTSSNLAGANYKGSLFYDIVKKMPAFTNV